LDSIKRNFDIVNLGNNHTNNFGAKGLLQARKFLSDAGLSYFGDPLNSPDYLSTTTEKNGIKIGFVSYMQLANTGFDVVLDEIKRLRPSVDMLIALPHWGIEYETEKPWARQQEEAYAMIDAGVDTIIGTHPHVIQPIEQYNGKTIFYSLGNFIFDQYFSEETMQGLTVRMNIEKDTTSSTVSYILQPVVISKRSQVSVAPGDVTKTILDHLSQVSIVSSTVQEEIARGSFK
jgi:poly-gamma-glutamate synthesis protein (capsule biosynthesis protein)